MKAKFEPGLEAANVRAAQSIIDREADNASEQRLAVNLEQIAAPASARFVVDQPATDVDPGAAGRFSKLGSHDAASASEQSQKPADEQIFCSQPETVAIDLKPETATDPNAWRQEVAARLNKYRERRRPRAPRYPSLRLKFEPGQLQPAAHALTDARPISRHATVEDVQAQSNPAGPKSAYPVAEPLPTKPVAPETTARIIEFPRLAAPPRPLDELAEPVMGRPRILEAPEIVPPSPALGGILIEAAEPEANERRPGFEMPLQPARMMRRLGATAMDVLIVGSAVCGFGYLFFRVASLPPLLQAARWGLILAGVFWASYQYLFLVHCGTTLGLSLMKLQLSRFDGKPAPRSIRRWRVLASLLSAMSLGLGYAWCMLDEDELCWHDRITHTYMAPREGGTPRSPAAETNFD